MTESSLEKSMVHPASDSVGCTVPRVSNGIPITHENVETLKKWGMGLERVLEHCAFCSTPTRYWHLPTNKVVCESCALIHTVAELRAHTSGVRGTDNTKEKGHG